MKNEVAKIEKAARALRKKVGTPRVVVIMGSGMSEVLPVRGAEIPFERIPGFPASSVEGHAGRLSAGTLRGVPIVVLRGRSHFYEGIPLPEIVRPVRVMATLGAEILIVTNAAGALHPKFRPGDLMMIRDHINMMGGNPLEGRNLKAFGPRFPDLTHAYDPQLLKRTARIAGRGVRRGIYVAVRGPSYETPAEVRLLRKLGADAVGMSTVPEVIAAVHASMRVVGISCITNMAAGMAQRPLNHREVVEVTGRVRERLGKILEKFIVSIRGSR